MKQKHRHISVQPFYDYKDVYAYLPFCEIFDLYLGTAQAQNTIDTHPSSTIKELFISQHYILTLSDY